MCVINERQFVTSGSTGLLAASTCSAPTQLKDGPDAASGAVLDDEDGSAGDGGAAAHGAPARGAAAGADRHRPRKGKQRPGTEPKLDWMDLTVGFKKLQLYR